MHLNGLLGLAVCNAVLAQQVTFPFPKAQQFFLTNFVPILRYDENEIEFKFIEQKWWSSYHLDIGLHWYSHYLGHKCEQK